MTKWDSLQTTAAIGTGNTQYSGVQPLNTNSRAVDFELSDVVSSPSYTTYNLNHATSGPGTIYTDADNTWGDGTQYVAGSSTTSANGQTAAADAHYGAGKTLAYYFNVLGRNGIDGAGRATCNYVHYSTSYSGVFWTDSSYCMFFGDGDGTTVTSPTSLDVVGHEMAHGVTSRTAGLVYSGESGGLNESMSDINGTMVEFYTRGGSGSTIGNTGGTWTIGEQVSVSSTPFRYMYKPSKDGSSKDAWYSGAGATTYGGGGGTNLLGNPGFESGATVWSSTASVIGATNARTGSYAAWLDGYGTAHTDTLSQTVTNTTTTAATQLCFWLKITTAETTTTTAYDKLTVTLGATTLGTLSNLDASTYASYAQKCYAVSVAAGASTTVKLSGVEDSSLQTSFIIDDTSLQ